MLSQSALGRAVRSTSCITAPSGCVLNRSLAAHQHTFRPSHQRRLSSSKTSIPPDSSNGERSTQQTPAAGASKAPARKMTGRVGRRKATTPPALNVPHVPMTDFLQKPDVKVSSFFSLHRPISINTTATIPPVTTRSSFDSIFLARTPDSKNVMMDNIQTLAGGISQLEAVLQEYEQKQPTDDAMQSEIHHLDGAPQMSVDALMAQLLPFRPPPVPAPLNETSALETAPQREVLAPVAPPKQRAWSTEVVVTESTDASGKRTYSATTAPMVEIQLPTAETIQETDGAEIRQPFLERMKQRQNTYDRYLENQGRSDMLLISVKRQRKLKMKKHKYKKLMKRTRLLRRKLDRA